MCNVLVLEDNDLVWELLVECLELEGYEVASCSTPQGALARINSVPQCRMLATDVDLGMDDLDGFAVASKVRVARADLPVLFMSGRPDHMIGRHLGHLQTFLAKPFQMGVLFGVLCDMGIVPSGQSRA